MTIYLGSTPCEEECASVGDEHYQSDARIEIGAYIDQLNRTFHFHRSDLGITFRKKREPHDFGGYYEVVVDFEGFNWLSSPLAYVIEEHTPDCLDKLEQQLASRPEKVVAIGEIGLDLYRENPQFERQEAVLEAQLKLA